MILQNIQKLCDQHETNISKVERELGFSNGCIRKWENSSPSVSKLGEVARRFGVTVDELLSDADEISK